MLVTGISGIVRELLGRKIFQGLREEEVWVLVQALDWIGKKSPGESPSITAAVQSQSFSAYTENKGRESCAKSHL